MVRMNESKEGRKEEWMNERMKGSMNEWMKGWKVERMNERMKGWTNERMIRMVLDPLVCATVSTAPPWTSRERIRRRRKRNYNGKDDKGNHKEVKRAAVKSTHHTFNLILVHLLFCLINYYFRDHEFFLISTLISSSLYLEFLNNLIVFSLRLFLTNCTITLIQNICTASNYVN